MSQHQTKEYMRSIAQVSKDDKMIIKTPMMGEAPWCKMPMDLVKHPAVQMSYIRVYAFIDFKAGKRGYWYGYQKDMAPQMGVSLRQLTYALLWLQNEGFITTHEAEGKRNRCRVYCIPARAVSFSLQDVEREIAEEVTQYAAQLESQKRSPLRKGTQPIAQHNATDCATLYKENHRPLPQTSNHTLAPTTKTEHNPLAPAEPAQECIEKNERPFNQQEILVWAGLVGCFGGEPTIKRERKQWEIVTRELAAAGADGQSVRKAYHKHFALFKDATPTPMSLVKNWTLLNDSRSGYAKINAPPVDPTPPGGTPGCILCRLSGVGHKGKCST